MTNLVKKQKARLMQEMNLKGAETSFSDYGAKEVLTDISSTNIQTLAMQRLSTDYTLCDIVVLYKGRINIAKGKNTVDLVSGGFYVYENVDITVWREIRRQALTGNSVGKAVIKHLRNDYEGVKIDV